MIQDTPYNRISELIARQRHFFGTHQTKDIAFRIRQLKNLKKALLHYESAIAEALWQDLHKSYEEAFLTELNFVLQEIDLHLKNLRRWSKPTSVRTPLHLWPSSSRIEYEPLGVALIIAPWNYPFQLLINPLVGAISAGCCALLKPSPFVPHTSLILQKIIEEVFEDQYIAVVQGGKEVNEFLLQHRFDLIFFTGSTTVGKIIMKAAAEFLTPVILELGGKSPCIVDADANLAIAAKRIAWGKTINSGQTCIAPDYLLVHSSVKEKLVELLALSFEELYGKDIKESRFYPRLVHEQAYERIEKFCTQGTVLYGGQKDATQRFVAPTLLQPHSPDSDVMQEEIFGPVLPVLVFDSLDEAIQQINKREKPLALYFFGISGANKVLAQTSSGGVCINDTIMHVANDHLPFGGVGQSGQGKYHGYFSFLAFSNARAVVRASTLLDLPFRYPPFRGFQWIRKFL